MILVIDNYDSFVFNLARYVQELGHTTQVVRNDKISLESIAAMQPSHIILSPGPKAPIDAGICLSVVSTFAERIPMLGVCLGHQVIGQVYGAKIGPAQRPMHGKASRITHNGAGIFKGLPQGLSVGRYHSLIVDRGSLDPAIAVTSWSEEGEIMSLASPSGMVVGVQFHPESVLTEGGYQLLENWLAS